MAGPDANIDVDAQPDLLPVSMLHAFVYCPRLFHLEWVGARWADNDDIEAGRLAHRVVDTPSGRVPDAEEAELLRAATSVHLSSERLGLVAVVDRIEGDDGWVVPVEVKRGRPDPDGCPWPADRAQVLAQAALLQDAGYQVREAVMYYAAVRRRVRIDLAASTDGADVDGADGDGADGEGGDAGGGSVAERETVALLAQARVVAGALEPPLPLVDSPKCPRCSLAGLCLPDETNALLERSELAPRRIVPRDPDPRPVYVTEPGAAVGVRGGRLVVTKNKEPLTDVRLLDASQLCVYGRVQVSTDALARLWARGVPVLWFSYGGWLRGWAAGEPSKYVELRRRQVLVHAQGGQGIAARLIEGKIANQRTLLRRNAKTDLPAGVLDSLTELRTKAASAEALGTLLGLEGTAARLYFGAFPAMVAGARAELVAGFTANGRRRRPPPDAVNCLLGFVYALLVKDLVAVCLAVGLDPFLGVLHRPRYGRPALALDLAEEFRPLAADSVVVGLLNNGEIDAGDFETRHVGVMLTKAGRKRVVAAYERRLEQQVTHPVFGYQISYRRLLEVQARMLAAVMLGELPEYTAMTTR